jgi:DNA-binding beta-propeller fold protein YncE
VDWTLVALDAAAGTQRWVATHAGAGTALDAPSGMAVSADGGRVFVAATTCASATAPATCDLEAAAFDTSTGSEAWRVRVDGPGADLDAGGGVTVSPDGEVVYVAGLETRLATGSDAALLALDAHSGDVLWESMYDGVHGTDTALAAAVSQDGQLVFMTGSSFGGSTGPDFATIAVDADTGRRLWVARRDDHGGEDQPTAIGAGAGRVIVTGTTDNGPQGLQADYATVAYDAESGEALWTKTYNGGSFETPLDLSMSGTAVYVTGLSRGTSSGYDMATIGYDAATGQELWASRFNGLANNGDAAWSVEASPDGHTVYVGGDTLLPGAADYAHAVIAYNANDGSVLWTGLHRGGGPLGGSLREGLDVSPDGSRIYFAGQILAATTDTDFLTLAYDA